MINEATKATAITVAMFVALLSEHVTIAAICGLFLAYVLMKSMVEPNENEKAAGAGDTDDSNK